MPRAPWRRRGTSDSPRPAGRRWAGRLRRSGVFARRVLRPRHRPPSGSVAAGGVVSAGGAAGTVTVDPFDPYQYAYPPLPPERPVAADAGMPPAAAGKVRPPAADPAPPGVTPARPSAPEPAGAPILPGDRTLPRQLGFLLVNCCTLASLTLGVLAILLAMRGDVAVAASCLVACVALDGLDGVLARRLGVSSPFGAQMDSLADMCAFGLAAPVVVYASVAGTVPAPGAAVACALVAGCAAIRLARFNVSPKNGRFFTGVPTTLAAGVLALAVLVELPLPPVALLLGAAALAFAMVSTFPYATLARLLRLPPWLWLVPLAGALVDARITFVALVAAYLASGPLLWLHQHRRRVAA